jgi:hypothetical protein
MKMANGKYGKWKIKQRETKEERPSIGASPLSNLAA